MLQKETLIFKRTREKTLPRTYLPSENPGQPAETLLE
jgi:hypothetical protein